MKKKQIFNFYNLGQSLVELVLLMGLLGIILPVLITGFASSREGKVQQKQRLKATALLKETEEAVRTVREMDWESFSIIPTSTPYHPEQSTSWTMVAGVQNLPDSFSREVVFDEVKRKVTGEIDPAGTIVDPSTKKITVTVHWTQPHNSSVQSIMYLTRWDNLTRTETYAEDFNVTGSKFDGTKTTTLTGDASIVLQKSGGGGGNWCDPNLKIGSYSIPNNGVGIAISSVPNTTTGQPDYAYITTGQNAASFSLSKISISDPPKPATPVASLTSPQYNEGKDYGVYANNNYVFVAATNVGGPKKIDVDIISTSTLTRAGYFSISSNMTPHSVYVSGNTGYVTANSSLIAFDVSTIDGTKSQSESWIVALNNNVIGHRVVVSGNYAYIATSGTGNSQQLQIVNLNNHSIYSPPASGPDAINTNQPATDVAVLNNYVYLVTSYNSSAPDIFVIDVTNPETPRVVGRATTTGGMSPNGVATTLDNVIVIVGNGGDQYQVFIVSSPTAPVQCGKLTNPNNATNVCAVSTLKEGGDKDVFSYILTTQGQCFGGSGATQQFQIISGGPTGGSDSYLSTGTFESKPFDPGYSTAFNRFTASVDQTPPSTQVGIKVAVVNKINNSCTDPGINYDTAYIGPNGGSNYFTSNNNIIQGTIPFGSFLPNYSNPGQCFRYKILLTSDQSNTPSVKDITVNYSP